MILSQDGFKEPNIRANMSESGKHNGDGRERFRI